MKWGRLPQDAGILRPDDGYEDLVFGLAHAIPVTMRPFFVSPTLAEAEYHQPSNS